MTTPADLTPQLAGLRAEFPDVMIFYTRPPETRPVWWATRGGVTGPRMDERDGFTASSADELRELLRAAAKGHANRGSSARR
ncbi:hypothetical protein [Actinomadura litoris]|uniref:hypothetical protein n=1 Tax=Actinomadura litoris TaxID=2678616 RepID=UPI001FA7B4DA|nr:hypothetical protein [Actinomadura litoris]